MQQKEEEEGCQGFYRPAEWGSVCVIVAKCGLETPTVAGTTTEEVFSILAGVYMSMDRHSDCFTISP